MCYTDPVRKHAHKTLRNMKIAAFICELNPLHEGHCHFISEARRKTGADYLIALMSGDFVQRGEPAVLPMHERAECALHAGADLVLQLPDVYACASAQYFAEGGVRLLDSLNCVDALCFGAECADGELLFKTVDLLNSFHKDMQPLIRKHLTEGMTYASARSKALEDLLREHEPALADQVSDLMRAPNNQLALAYLQAMHSIHSSMTPCTVPRDPGFKSSSQIRRELFNDTSSASEDPYLIADDFSLLLKDRLLRSDADALSDYLDVTPDLAHRIKNKQNEFLSWSQFTDLLHTKEMTRARISRCLCHILLGIRKDDLSRDIRYLRILGFNRKAAPLLSYLKECSALPLITKQDADQRDDAADLYQSVLTDKYGIAFIESHEQPVRVI